MLTVSLTHEKNVQRTKTSKENTNLYDIDKRVFYLLSLGRCGHHAIMNWICSQTIPSCYFNNCRRFKDGTASATEVYKYESKTPERIKNASGIDVYQHTNNIDFCILNFINSPVEAVYKHLKRSDINIIIVVRDVYNWVASCIRRGGGLTNNIPRNAEVWKSLVKTCIDKDVESDTNLIDINFNKWFSNKEYREDTANRLDIKFTDAGLENVEHIGKSDFEPHIIDGQKLDVFNRWQKVSPVKLSDNIDSEMIQLNAKYFTGTLV